MNSALMWTTTLQQVVLFPTWALIEVGTSVDLVVLCDDWLTSHRGGAAVGQGSPNLGSLLSRLRTVHTVELRDDGT